MGYVGNQTTNAYSSMDKQTITGNGGASYTLTHAVANAQEIEVFVNNVRQEAGVAYTVSGTALSMTGNVASTDDFYVIYQGKALQTVVPPDGSVSTGKLANGAVTSAKLANGAVTSAKLAGLTSSDMPAGSVLQVVQGTSNSNILINGTTFTNTNLSATITPSSTSSKILIEVSTGLDSSSAGNTVIGTIARGSTNLGHSTAGMTHGFSYNVRTIFPASVVYLDSPATTSATTYNFQVRAGGSYNVECPGTSITQVMILKEIAG